MNHKMQLITELAILTYLLLWLAHVKLGTTLVPPDSLRNTTVPSDCFIFTTVNMTF